VAQTRENSRRVSSFRSAILYLKGHSLAAKAGGGVFPCRHSPALLIFHSFSKMLCHRSSAISGDFCLLRDQSWFWKCCLVDMFCPLSRFPHCSDRVRRASPRVPGAIESHGSLVSLLLMRSRRPENTVLLAKNARVTAPRCARNHCLSRDSPKGVDTAACRFKDFYNYMPTSSRKKNLASSLLNFFKNFQHRLLGPLFHYDTKQQQHRQLGGG
jgi:hypothetical protein